MGGNLKSLVRTILETPNNEMAHKNMRERGRRENRHEMMSWVAGPTSPYKLLLLPKK